MTNEDADLLIQFLDDAHKAWGRDLAYSRLWGNLNLTICMWLYRRIVVAASIPSSRIQRFTREQFVKCLMSLSADDYVDWLVGRNSQTRDNSPAYMRIKQVFVRRMEAETGKRILMPQPAWSSK